MPHRPSSPRQRWCLCLAPSPLTGLFSRCRVLSRSWCYQSAARALGLRGSCRKPGEIRRVRRVSSECGGGRVERATSMLQLTTPMRLHTKSGTYVTPRCEKKSEQATELLYEKCSRNPLGNNNRQVWRCGPRHNNTQPLAEATSLSYSRTQEHI